jgi:four helix bundle protein
MDNREFKIKLEERTLKFAVDIVKFCSELKTLGCYDVLINQLLKAGTSIGANYREANRAESRKDFIHKIAIVEKEASETNYWLLLLQKSDQISPSMNVDIFSLLLKESKELLALFNSISRNSKKNL